MKGNRTNHENAGRKPKFKKKYGVTKRIPVSYPSLKKDVILKAIDKILEPYLL